jgi:hypothetical protein
MVHEISRTEELAEQRRAWHNMASMPTRIGLSLFKDMDSLASRLAKKDMAYANEL